ncbi:hypothetical protein [Rhizobium phage RHph_X3_15]|nr:hypothetical protein [Rhizobium phage RHph_X3_15]
MIFVFGSNLAGIHGAGAARVAFEKHGAVWGIGAGNYGNSYAIPTKDGNIKTLPLEKIKPFVNQFIHYAYENPHLEFQVTKIGCGLAGYKDEEIAPLFKDAPYNCMFDTAWAPWNDKPLRLYWGTY